MRFPRFCAVARNLKEIQGCKIVVALTHMRTPNDIRLAKEVDEIDLILGGHDHVSEFIQVTWKIPFQEEYFFVTGFVCYVFF